MQNAEGPPFLIEIAIEPRSAGDREKLDLALSELVQRYHTLGFTTDPETGQVVLKGTDEPQLEIIVDCIKSEFRVDADIGPPQIAYRETITRAAEVDHIHRKQNEFARVQLRLEPAPPGSGFAFDSTIGSALPGDYVRGVEQGLRGAAKDGVIAGFPMIDLKAILVDGSSHETDSNQRIFEVAGRAAFKECAAKAAPALLEPIMRVEIVTPDEYLGDVIGDLNQRRGMVIGLKPQDSKRIAEAFAPLANMFGHAEMLRSISQHQATFRIQFDHYQTVPTFEPPPDRFPPAIGMRG